MDKLVGELSVLVPKQLNDEILVQFINLIFNLYHRQKVNEIPFHFLGHVCCIQLTISIRINKYSTSCVVFKISNKPPLKRVMEGWQGEVLEVLLEVLATWRGATTFNNLTLCIRALAAVLFHNSVLLREVWYFFISFIHYFLFSIFSFLLI